MTEMHNPPHPGGILKDALPELGISITIAARHFDFIYTKLWLYKILVTANHQWVVLIFQLGYRFYGKLFI